MIDLQEFVLIFSKEGTPYGDDDDEGKPVLLTNFMCNSSQEA